MWFEINRVNTLVLTMLISYYSCKAQLNELTQTEYQNIKINDVTFQEIYDTNADLTKMKDLFGSNLHYEFENDILIRKEFWIPDLYYFNFNSDEGNYYFPTIIKIRSSLVTVTVKDITVKLGDNKSKFGSLLMNNNSNSIVFTDQDTGSVSLAFKIDESTNRIIEIEFNAY